MKVAVIGGAGNMGRWFTRYFIRRGFDITIYDVRKREAKLLSKEDGVDVAGNIRLAVEDAVIIFITTPIEETPKVIQKIFPLLVAKTIVVEISSHKEDIVKVIKKEFSRKDILFLSIHPLFGPGAQNMKGQKMVLIPIFDLKKESEVARYLFPEASFLMAEADEHDRMMAIVLSLTYFTNMIFSDVVSCENLKLLREMGGTSFTLQLTLAESILQNTPDLFSSIQLSNRYALQYLQKFLDRANELLKVVESNRRDVLLSVYSEIKEKLDADPDFKNSYKKIYDVMDYFRSSQED